MKGLLRFYPRSWRKRYGKEMEVLVEDMAARPGVALDLLVGAAVAYRDVVAGNRILSAAGAYLHGMCVAVLLQAIVFVSLVLAGQGSAQLTNLNVGPVVFASVYGVGPIFNDERRLAPDILVSASPWSWVPEGIALLILAAMLAILLASPRLFRSLR